MQNERKKYFFRFKADNAIIRQNIKSEGIIYELFSLAIHDAEYRSKELVINILPFTPNERPEKSTFGMLSLRPRVTNSIISLK
jgi:hypothetical protein